MTQTSVDHSGDAAAEVDVRRSRKNRDIGVLVFDGFSLSAAGALFEVFAVANEIHAQRSTGHPLYDIRFYSSKGGNIVWSSAISVRTFACDAGSAHAFDALFVAGGQGALRAARDARVIDWLRIVLPKAAAVEAIGEGRMLIDAARAGPHAIDVTSRVRVGGGGLGAARAALAIV
ncbi:hypothetical protein ACFQ7B_43690, partial [Streptomyces erythrochromogenes]